MSTLDEILKVVRDYGALGARPGDVVNVTGKGDLASIAAALEACDLVRPGERGRFVAKPVVKEPKQEVKEIVKEEPKEEPKEEVVKEEPKQVKEEAAAPAAAEKKKKKKKKKAAVEE